MGFFSKPTTMERIQVLLLPEDIEKVGKLARELGLKNSTLIRVAIKEYLKSK